MKRAGSGRVARKIGAYDDESAEGESAGSGSGSQNEAPAPVSVVKRPAFGKGKKRSSLRISFGPGDSGANDGDESSDAAVASPNKSNLSRLALEKSAQLRARSPLVQGVGVAEESRPAYSNDYIAELRSSTPTTPRDVEPDADADEQDEPRALDIAAKFGSAVSFPAASHLPTASLIPSATEIAEKKARRKRLALEEQAQADAADLPWASDDSGSDSLRHQRNEASLRPKDKYPETRLDHSDEDIAEGFDAFVDDGRISLSRKSARAAHHARRADIASAIASAQPDSDSASSDSDADRTAAFAAAQARAGHYGTHLPTADDGTTTPPKTTPLPDISDILSHLSLALHTHQQRKDALLASLQELKDDRVRIDERKAFLQAQLQKTGDEYEKLRLEQGLPALESAGGRLLERGLDSLGGTPGGTPGRTPGGSSDSP